MRSPAKTTDRRYSTHRWTELALRIRRRDGTCFVAGCMRAAEVADHIVPVYEGMPDSEFYDPRNLRGACKQHNLDRGRMAAAAARLGVGFSAAQETQDRPLSALYTQRSRVITTLGES